MVLQKRMAFSFDEVPAVPVIEGLFYFPSFIDSAMHNSLIESIDGQLWEHTLKRRVQQYGYRYDYKNRMDNDPHWLGPLPNWTDQVEALLHQQDIFESDFDQIIVNEYLPGQGIACHIDRTSCFGETIAILSLDSRVVMDLVLAKSRERSEILLKPRSLLVLKGPARYEWKHGIAARKSDRFQGTSFRRKRRISLTFRKTLAEP